jgi:hypothetical protein
VTYFGKNIQIPNFMKIRPVGAEPFHTEIKQADRQTERDRERDRQTDMTKLMVTFPKFANATET